LVDQDLEDRKKARYFQISDSENLINDLDQEVFMRPWGKLDLHLKINRLMKHAERLRETHNLTEDEFRELRIVLIGAVNSKKMNKRSDLDYDETTGEVKKIYGLTLNEAAMPRIFTYNNARVRQSGIKKPENHDDDGDP